MSIGGILKRKRRYASRTKRLNRFLSQEDPYLPDAVIPNLGELDGQ
jgi:hypothetical protein